jgi:hypothetical protein
MNSTKVLLFQERTAPLHQPATATFAGASSSLAAATLVREHIKTAELEAYTLLVPERTREDEAGSLLSRPEMR